MRLILLLIFTCFCLTHANSQWIQGNGPYGEQINTTCHSANELFAGTNSGVFRSSDNGQNWNLISPDLPDNQIWSLHYANGILYAGSNDRLYFTKDGGDSWDIIQSNAFGMLYCIYKSNEKVFVGTNNGLFVSTNDFTFKEILTNNEHYYQSHTITKIDSTLFVSADGPYPGNTLYKSGDNGATWAVADDGIDDGFVTSICKTNNQLLASAFLGGFYSSVDNGDSWIQINSTDTIDYNTLNRLVVMGKYLILTTDDAIYRSDTSSLQWKKIYYARAGNIDIKDNMIIIGLPGSGVKISKDTGVTWQFSNTGLGYADVWNLQAVKGSLQATTTGAGAFYSFDKGNNWVNYKDSTARPACFTANDSFYFYGSSDGIFRSKTGVSDWQKVATSLAYLHTNALWCNNSLIIASATGNYKFLSSNDNGLTWSMITVDTPIFKITTLCLFNDIIYVGTERGLFMFNSNGNQWNFVRSGSMTCWINGIIVIGSAVYVATNCGVYKSENNGIDWYGMNDGFKVGGVKGITVNGDRLFACAGEEGIFILNKDESKWEPITDNLPELYLHGIAGDDTNIYVGTTHYGVYKRAISEFTGVKTILRNDANQDFIYPNPAQSMVNIGSCKDGAQIKLFDIMGKEIRAIEFSNVLDVSKLSAGLYWIAVLDKNNNVLSGQKLIVQH